VGGKGLKLRRKMTVGIMLASLFASFMTFTSNVRPVKAQGTIHIRGNGSIEPSNASILTHDNMTYFFTGNITGYIVVERNDIVIDGSGFILASGELNNTGTGIDLVDIHNVTIKNTSIKNFVYGIHINNGPSNLILANKITHNDYGIYLESAAGEIISGNNIEDNSHVGIYIGSASAECVISRNDIARDCYGIQFDAYAGNSTFFHNNFISNSGRHVQSSGTQGNRWDDGYPSCGNYWSGYTGDDLNSGLFQNETGSDEIGDLWYFMDDFNFDNYPLMDPWTINPPDPSHMIVSYPNALARTLDPAQDYDTASQELVLNVYETLIFFDEAKTDQFVPRLATKWEISPDGLNYTFSIRQGVKFHNGGPLTTEDVEYSFERLLVIEGGPAWMLYEAFFNSYGSRDAEGNFTITGQQIDNAITRNATTVTLHLTKPYPPMMQILSQTWASVLCKQWCVGIGDWPGTWNNWTLYNRPSQTAIEAQNTEPPGPHVNAMCGTGPFMLDYYKKRSKWSIVKFDDYWGGWLAPDSAGSLQRVTSKRISDWGVRKNMFLEGQLDYIGVPSTAIGEVLAQPGVQDVYPLEELVCEAMFFTFNISASSPYLGIPGGLPKGTFNQSGIPPDFFSDINIRKGFACAFNYSKLIEEEFGGEAYQPATPIIPGLPFYNPAQEKYSTNLEIAANYFVTAWGGEVWNNGFNLTICYNAGNSIRGKACEIIKTNVESLNSKFHIQMQPLPYDNYSYLTQNHEVPVFWNGWLADFADPHNFVWGFMYSSGGFPPWQLYSNVTIDILMYE
jgi:peptide/nickel transport system substrate-binding protein